VDQTVPELARHRIDFILFERSLQAVSNFVRQSMVAFAKTVDNGRIKPQSGLDLNHAFASIGKHSSDNRYQKWTKCQDGFASDGQENQTECQIKIFKLGKGAGHSHGERQTLSVEEAGRILGISRAAAYQYRFPDGRFAEVFLNVAKSGTSIENHARDAAIVASIALRDRGGAVGR
jgi:hypothetical protein